jgi:uncharacterized protein
VIVVSNASPLIILAKLGLFDLPQRLFSSLVIAAEVWHEVAIQGAGLPGAVELQQALQAGWVTVQPVANVGQLTIWQSQFALGTGELATIQLAKELAAAFALIDERRARLLAKAEVVSVLGTVGLLELAYRRGEIADLRQVYQTLLRQGARINRKILNQSLVPFHLQPI